MVTIINYGLGNIGSIANMFKRINVQCNVAADVSEIERAEKILLPGVGAFDAAMSKIKESKIEEVLKYKALEEKVPFLGICLGMQLLTNRSEEGVLPGLGFVPGKTIKFSFDDRTLKIPHMGWNVVVLKNPSPVTTGMETEEQRFYFVHSYYVKCDNPENVVAQTTYGLSFDCIIQNGNVFGAQFHPERSHRFGMKFLSNFAAI